MSAERQVRLFRDGRSQAVHIPREWELAGDTAAMRIEGGRLILEPLQAKGLLATLSTLPPLSDSDAPADWDQGLGILDDVHL